MGEGSGIAYLLFRVKFNMGGEGDAQGIFFIFFIFLKGGRWSYRLWLCVYMSVCAVEHTRLSLSLSLFFLLSELYLLHR